MTHRARYAVPSLGVPLGVGLALVLAPAVAGVLLIHRLGSGGPRGPDGLRVVTGILAAFLALDSAFGLGGRYDLTVGALATAFALRWLSVRERAAA